MASIKLNVTDRKNLSRVLLKKGFEELEKKLRSREKELSEQAYRFLLQDRIRKPELMDAFLSLPGKYFPVCNRILVRTQKYPGLVALDLETSMAIPEFVEQRPKLDLTTISTSFANQVDKFIEERADLRTEKDNAEKEIRGLLNAVSSTKQLKEAWPEISEIVDEVIKPAGSTAIVANREHLNKIVGLK